MNLTLAFILIMTLAGSIGAMAFRNVVHCALSLVVAFLGLAIAYLNLGADFVGFAQILVYVGAVAVLIVFSILLTRGGESKDPPQPSRFWFTGPLIAGALFFCLVAGVISSGFDPDLGAAPPYVSINELGSKLMSDYVLTLETIGVLLTVALLGAVIIVLKDRPDSDLPDGGASDPE